jgi:acetyl esterase/lipase
MKILFASICLAFVLGDAFAQTNVWQPSPGHTQIPIWPGNPPDAQSSVFKPESVRTTTGQPTVIFVNDVTRPTITVYSPKGTNTGVAVIVFPGGGYNELAMDLEGTEICDWLNSIGVTAVLLKYRVPTREPHAYGESKRALEDAQRALSLVRFNAAKWQINPHKIGVIGFSAGGGMVSMTSTHFDHRSYTPVDDADKESCRPDFAIACYPGHLWEHDEGFKLNPDVTVASNTPPTFIVQAEDDHVDGVNQSLVYYIGLKNAGVLVEMHLYAQGGHGFGLRPSKNPVASEWPKLAGKWLNTIGMTP